MIKTVLDIGGGDIEILQDVAVEHYLGIDLSEIIIRRNKIPRWTFVCADLAKGYDSPSADLVLCLSRIGRSLAHSFETKVRKSYGC
jgi:hypothetical protein